MRKPRLFTLPAVVCAGLLASVLAAGPALAAGGPVMPSGPSSSSGTGSGCSGATCYAQVWSHITLSGNAVSSSGGSSGPAVAMPPPPCYESPLFSGPEMYTLWKEGQGQRVGPNGTPADQGLPAGQIQQHKNDNNGSWYSLTINLQVPGPCNLPNYVWVPNNTSPPLPQVPQVDLADYAYNHMTIGPPTLKFSPANRSIVNLPTYVWDQPPFNGKAQVTATLGNESARVTATPSNLQLSVAGSGTVYESGCTASGSTASDPPKNAGPGTTPDCGVVFSAPGADSITGTLVWTPTGGGRTFPQIRAGRPQNVTVAEIQNLNN